MYRVLLSILICAFILLGCVHNQILLPNGKVIKVELAKTEEETERGLMFRQYLVENEGMLFVFPKDDIRLFWMKNTLIDLDMVFIDSTGEITSIAKEVPHSYIGALEEEIAQIAGFGKYVLEINAGLADKYNLKAGDRLILKIK